MVKTIKFFDPRDKQYGELSNNYRYWMTIDKVKYPTITNFIYSNMLVKPQLRQELQQFNSGVESKGGSIRDEAKTVDIMTKYMELVAKERNIIIKNAVENAYRSKLDNKDNLNLRQKLLSTGNAPIKYISQNNFLGVGPQGTGNNIVGKYLMQIRLQLRNAKIKQERDYAIYEAYLAQKGLQTEIFNGSDLSIYLGKSPSAIIDMIGRSVLVKGSLGQDTIIDVLHKKGLIDNEVYIAVDHPTTLVQSVRKNELAQLRQRQLARRIRVVFEMYSDYTLEKHYPDLKPEQYSQAREQQITKVGLETLVEMEKQAYYLFTEGMLSERLSDNIDRKFLDIPLPSTKDVAEAQEYVPPPLDGTYLESIGNPIEIHPIPQTKEQEEYSVFSPIDNTNIFTIDNRQYPTICHFITISLIANIPTVKTMDKAYEYIIIPTMNSYVQPKIKFQDYNTLSTKYQNLYDIDRQTRMSYFMQLGLNKKFEDRLLQDILIMTGDANLVWDDFNDPILGVGSKEYPGTNIVGKYLMTLRDQLILVRKNEKIDAITTEDITSILSEDKFLYGWIQMRVKDMCKVIYTMKQYIDTKLGTTTEMSDVKMVMISSTTLDTIYQPCSHIFGSVDKITAHVPHYFRVMVQLCPGFKDVSADVVDVIWKRIAVMFYYLIEHTKLETTANIRNTIAGLEKLVSKGGPCVEIVTNTRDNCIISALVNLISGISKFNTILKMSPPVTKQDVETATSIILNKDVSDEINPGKLEEINDPHDYLKDDQHIADEMAKKFYNDYTDGIIDKDTMAKRRSIAMAARSKYWADRIKNKDKDKDKDNGDDSDIDKLFETQNDALLLGEEEAEDSVEMEDSVEYDKLVNMLKSIDNIDNPGKIASLIAGAVPTIRNYSMPDKIRYNRINFFATQK